MFAASTRRSSAALWVVFFVNGAVLASWAPRIPQVKAELALTDGQMGWALFGIATGSVPALIGAARLLEIVTARTVTLVSAMTFAGALPLIAAAPNGWSLGFALAVLGAASGCLDVAMNTAAIGHQDRTGTRILSRLHGGYSLGALVGATAGALASALQVTVLAHFVYVSGTLLLLVVFASPFLPHATHGPGLPSATNITQSPAQNDLSARTGIKFRALAIPVGIGLSAIAALLIEGMVTDWSALLVSRDLGGGATLGATAVVAFSFSMFVSRSFGDHLVDRFGGHNTLGFAALTIGAATVGGLVLQDNPWGVVAMASAIGVALGPIFPLLIAEAGRRSNRTAAIATARVSAIGYGAYLGGPPLVGFLADRIGLQGAFLLVALTCSICLASASRSLWRNSAPLPRQAGRTDPADFS